MFMVGRLGVAHCRMWWKVVVEGEDVEIQSGQDGQVYVLEHRGGFNIGLREMVRGTGTGAESTTPL